MHRPAASVEQGDATATQREEQVVRLHEHGGELQPVDKRSREGERLAGDEHAAGRQPFHGRHLVEQGLEVAILRQVLQRLIGVVAWRARHVWTR